jgi:hypothetical protein
MSRDEIYRVFEEYILVESRGFGVMGHLDTRSMRGTWSVAFSQPADKLHGASGDTLIRAGQKSPPQVLLSFKSPLPSSFSIINTASKHTLGCC